MQIEANTEFASTAQQLRPVVITVVAAKLAVFALLMTTINFQAPMQQSLPLEIASVR